MKKLFQIDENKINLKTLNFEFKNTRFQSSVVWFFLYAG